MAITQNLYDANGSTTNYAFTFPYLKTTDIKVQLDSDISTAWSLANATTVAFDSPPDNGVRIKIYRETDTETSPATFYAGSAIKSEDLNDNFTQNLYSNQEVTARYLSNLGGTMTGNLTMGEDAEIIFEGATDDAYETTLTVADPTADHTITLPNVTGTIVTTGDTGTVNATMLAANSVDSSELVDGSVDLSHMSANSVDSDQYVDGSIDLIHMSANSVDSDQYVDGSIDLAHMSANSVDSDQYVDGSIDHVHLSADCIDGDNIQDDVINSEHIAAGAVDLEHMSANSVDSDQYVDGSIDLVHMSANSVDSDQYVDGSIDLIHMSANSVDSDQYVDGSIDRVHLSADIIDATKIEDNAVTTDHIADAELTTLAGMQTGTASVLASGTALAATTAEINSVCENRTSETTITDSDAKIPTSGAVVDYVAAQLAPIGGLEVIANKDSFPETQPASGVVVSIADAGGIVVNGSGTSTTPDTITSDATVTINGINSAFNSTTVDAGVSFMVSSTGSGQIYNFHKATLKEADILSLSGDINDFAERYRVSANPDGLSNKDEGDLVYDTAADKMKVYDSTTSAWKEVTSTGDFKYLVLTNAGTTNAATYGSATSYDLKESSTSGSAASVTSAAQLMVSVNGVVQKPNTGTSAPTEGFAMVDADTIIFSTAPPANSSVFVIQFGSALSATTPADNTVSSAKIQNGSVVQDKLGDQAVNEAKMQISNAGSNGQFLSKQSGNTGGLTWATVNTDVVSDTTPQLGGDLDVLDKVITTTTGTNTDITIKPKGTGDLQVGPGDAEGTISANGTYGLRVKANESGASGAYVTCIGGTNGGIDISPIGTGFTQIVQGKLKVSGNGSESHVTTHMTSHLKLNTNEGSNSGEIEIEDGSNNDIKITPNGTGDVIIDGLKYPQADGSSGQFLKTDGSGQLSWDTVTSDPTTTSGTNNFTVADGNLVIGTAGHGIDFSATANADQNSPTMSNELLDDYEEGSWTPRLVGFTTAGTGTYPTLAGSYTKIGRMVFCSFTIYQSAHTGSGAQRVDGLPFTAHLSNGTYTNSDGSHNVCSISGESLTMSKHQVVGHLENYNDRFRTYQFGSDGSSASPSWIEIENGNVWLSGTLHYETNS